MLNISRIFVGRMSIPCMCLAMLFVGSCATTDHPPISDDKRNLEQDYTYLIGPGDALNIFVWGNEELTISVPVRPDGKITTRLVEDIPASGRTSTQLAREIEKAYSEYVKNPVVSVLVNGFIGIPTQQVRIVGGANQPLSVPFRKHMTLLDLMIAVGGLDDFAAGNKSVIIRDVEGDQKTYSLRLDDLIRDGDISANYPLLPGDIVIIPEAWF